MYIENLFTTQRNLRRKQQIERIANSIKNNEYVEPVLLSREEDGTVKIENGHHRVIAYYVAGRKELDVTEYQLIEGDTDRRKICKITDLLKHLGL